MDKEEDICPLVVFLFHVMLKALKHSNTHNHCISLKHVYSHLNDNVIPLDQSGNVFCTLWGQRGIKPTGVITHLLCSGATGYS